jgi:hypothetical protein
MRGAVGDFVAVAIVVMRSCQELARLDKHFADMLVAVHRRSDSRHVVKIENVHGGYLSMIKNVKDK